MWEWYANTSRRFVSPGALTAARRPSVVLGAIGCLAIYAIGTLAVGRRVGWLAAILLMANPLYRMHARRAMSDVPAEALILATLAVGLCAWKRLLGGRGTVGPVLALAMGSGVLGGLATLSKLNGALAGLVLAIWAGFALNLSSFPIQRRLTILGATVAAGLVSFATFAALNPFLYAHPRGPSDPRLEPIARQTFAERVATVARHRAVVSSEAKFRFPNDALSTPWEKVEAVVVQGFGRFGPFGPRGWTRSTIRLDWNQDWGAVAWLPWVGLGLLAAIARGRAQLRAGEPPTAGAVALYALVAGVIVTAFIPLAWDRYYLSIQPGSALLAAIGTVEAFDRIGRFFKSTKA